MAQEPARQFRVGDRVIYRGGGVPECGIVVHSWDDPVAEQDCYVAFLGDRFPDGRPERLPYVLRYGAGSLERASAASTSDPIPDDLYRRILEVLPIPCVDLAIVHRDRLLLLRRTRSPLAGVFWLPGGRIRRGESLEAAAVRKAREETGLDVRLDGQLGTFSTVFEASHTINVTWLATPLASGPVVSPDRDHDGFRWHDLAAPIEDEYLQRVADLVRTGLRFLLETPRRRANDGVPTQEQTMNRAVPSLVLLVALASSDALAQTPPGADSPETLFEAMRECIRTEDWKGFVSYLDPESIRTAMQPLYDKFQKDLAELPGLPEEKRAKRVAQLQDMLGLTVDQAKELTLEGYTVAFTRFMGSSLRTRFVEGSIGEFAVDASGDAATAELTWTAVSTIVRGGEKSEKKEEKKEPFRATRRDGRWFHTK